MNVGVIDADLIDGGTRHPNLALMKISAHQKNQGNNVKLLTDYNGLHEYDHVYVSKVFTYTDFPDKIKTMKNITIGGTGFFEDKAENLPNHIEHIMPDYELYNDFVYKKIHEGASRNAYKDYLDYSIGFTTRGCFRKCSFCVNKKYNSVFKHADVWGFLDNGRPYIYLWDDNFLGYKHWKSILEQLKKTGKPFKFRQGLDIRLITDEKAKALSEVKYHGDFIFAFDFLKDKKIIERKLKIWKNYVRKTTKLYVLCAYESQGVVDIVSLLERIKVLMRHGCLPYVMRHENYKKSDFRDLYVQIARWCNQPNMFKKMSFREFAEANQRHHKNKNTDCSTMRTLKHFENNHPTIARKYFDLKFIKEKETIYLEDE